MCRPGGGTGRHAGLIDNLSASLEMERVEPIKFGETFNMVIPSQALKREGVET
jgi:hypothetical protein